MRKFTLFFVLMFVFSVITVQASQKRKVLFIGIDGTRSDALQQANTPNLDQLFAQGLSTYNEWCLGITISGPSWSSMMTGVWFNKHGVTNNSYTGSNFNTYPYFTTLAKQIKPDLYCAEVCEWPPLIDDVYNDNFNLKLHTPDGQGPTTCATAATVLANDSIDFMFVYFDQVDLTGHSSGFDPNNPAYIQAIENVDSCVGVVINALHNRAHYADEDWLIIVDTDHGGTGKGHGGNSNEERHIWWIAVGNDLQNVTPSGVDPGTYNPLVIGVYSATGVDTAKMHQTPVQTDVAVTALHHLIYDSGINPMNQTAWALDGKSWLKDNASTAVSNTPVEPVQLKIFPNPATDRVTVYFNNDDKKDVCAGLYDMQGRNVKMMDKTTTPNKINFDVTGLAAGNYVLRVQVGDNVTSRNFTVVAK